MSARPAIAAAGLAFALTLLYAGAVQPAWEPQHNDQQQYLALARGIVERGEFTRATPSEAFIPETERLPGYPLLIAPLCVGGCDHWRIAALQAALFAILVVVAWLAARRMMPPHAGLVALLVALYLPYAYYGSLALSDLAGAVLVAVAALAWLRGDETGRARWMGAAGALLGWAALMRASLLLLPTALALLALRRGRVSVAPALACVVGAAIVFAPYVAYSERSFGRPIGGNGGTVLFLGALQFRDEAALDPVERAVTDAARAEIDAFDAMTDRVARALAWTSLDASLGAKGRELVAHDPLGWIARAVPRSVQLWAGDQVVPGEGNDVVVAVAGAVQVVLFLVGGVGLLRAARRGSTVALVALVVVAYVWATSVPFQTEGRYALPARMFLLMGAVEAFRPRSLTTSKQALS